MRNKEPVIFQIGWNACINCGACVAVCPKEAGFISEFDTIAVLRPCDIACMVCEDICPVSTISHIQLSDWKSPDFTHFKTLAKRARGTIAQNSTTVNREQSGKPKSIF